MHRTTLLLGSALLALAPALPAAAQSGDAANAQRIERLERELRAVQRRVFPGSEGGLFQPEVTPGDTTTTTTTPATTPVADLTARVDAIEAQLARLTGEIEQTSFRQREMEAAIGRLRAELSGRIDALTPGGATTPGDSAAATTPAATAVTPAPTATPATTPTPTPAPRAATPAPAAAPTATASAPAATPSAAPANAARRAQVAAVEVPSTGNAAEDAYIYGFRLWSARLYPEAQVQLQKVIDDHPNHRRASYAGNLLGRAYLDNNQPALAVRAFYDNYRARPRGERAAESVYYMGMALIRLNRAADACRTFDEFTRNYGDTATDALKSQVATARGQARC